jgi:hypothetical protein
MPAASRLADPHGRLAEVGHQLTLIVATAAAALPPGWRLELVAGTAFSAELRLIDPRGRPLPRFCRTEHGPVWEAYRRFADQVYAAQGRLYPELAGRLAWGGMWGGQDGRWVIGHFDLAGLRGRGRYRPPGRRGADGAACR